jgi:hypothetical protein
MRDQLGHPVGQLTYALGLAWGLGVRLTDEALDARLAIRGLPAEGKQAAASAATLRSPRPGHPPDAGDGGRSAARRP